VANATLMPDPGVQLGSNLDVAPHDIPNGMGRYVQDVILDTPGIVRQRGNLDINASDFPGLPTQSRIIGLTSLADPSSTDTFRLLLLVADKNTFAVKAYIYGRSVTNVTSSWSARAFFDLEDPINAMNTHGGDPFLYIDDRRAVATNFGALLGTLTLSGMQVLNSDPDPFFSSSLALDGGALFGMGLYFSNDANRASHRAMFHWRGAAKADYTTGTVTVAVGSPLVTGAGTGWTANNIEPGMFLYQGATRFLGVVKSINFGTQVITLEQNAITGAAAGVAYTLTSIRRPYVASRPYTGAGTITTATTSAVVNGGGTKFTDMGLAAGDSLWRTSDNTFIGSVLSVQSNIQLTLAANAGVPMASEDFYISKEVSGAVWTSGQEPVFATYYNGMQLLANADNNRQGFNERSRIFVTDAKFLDSIDLTKTGSYYDLPSTKPHTDIRGLQATESAALVFLAEATYGLFGTTPDALVPKVISNDGLLSPMSVQPYQGGAVWAGHRSVYFFDGANVQDLLRGKAQSAHQRAIAGLDFGRLRCWSMLHNRHYVCFISSVNSGIFTHTQGRQNTTDTGALVTDPVSIVYSINLDTGALVFWTNVNVRGYTAPPGKLVNLRDAYFVVERADTGGPAICSAEALFQDAGRTGGTADDVLSNPTTSTDFAPHFYVEGKFNTFGQPEQLKRFQMLLVQYTLYGGNVAKSKLGMDIVTDMGEVTKAISPKAATSNDVSNPIKWVNKRSRFGKKATMAATRFYTMNDGQPTAARLGPWSLGFKWMRPGRV
jgi:hypothetical protein